MTLKVLLTIPFRLIPGLIILLFCIGVFLLGSAIKTVVMPHEPLLDYSYLDTGNEPPMLLEWYRSIKLVSSWIIFGRS